MNMSFGRSSKDPYVENSKRQSSHSKPSSDVEKVIRQVTSKSLFNRSNEVLTPNKNVTNQNVNKIKSSNINTPSPKSTRKRIGKGNIENVTPKSKTPVKQISKDKKTPLKQDFIKLKQNKTPVINKNVGNQTFSKDGATNKSTPKKTNETVKKHSIAQSIDTLPVPVSDDQSSIKVAVRVRPFNKRELLLDATSIIAMNDDSTTITNPSNDLTNRFTFDYSFWSFDSDEKQYANQDHIFKKVGLPLLEYSFEGYNTCLFAYGQTGSGKSYTIMGYEDEEEGIVPRFSRSLFAKVNEIEANTPEVYYSVEMSFYEIYNEKIFDLLDVNIDGNRQRLCVREHPDLGPYVQGLSLQVVRNMGDIQDWLEVGNKNRATAATGMNEKSSRSHSVFTIILTQVKNEMFDGTETKLQKTSKINLIDLAGSERAHQVYDDRLMKDAYTANTRIKEGSCINKSLHTLGKVISILSEKQTNPKKKYVYIPYRDSVLTWLLKESLGGNARTAMLATISPADVHYSETLSTLRYANQARLIVNKARVNEDPKSKLIREMMTEIERLKSCQDKTGDRGNALEKEVLQLREKLKETQGALASSAKNWQQKFEESEKKQKEATKHLRRSGIAFTKLETQNPCLVNLNEDAQLTEVLVYILQKGETTIGCATGMEGHHIKLKGDLVASKHCSIYYDDDKLELKASENAATYVNGNQISDYIRLYHGDRLVIGGDQFFRINFPKEINTANQKSSGSQHEKSYQFAKDELFKKQNERLYKELEEAKQNVEEKALEEIKRAQEEAHQKIQSQRDLFLEKQKQLENELKQSVDAKKAVEQSHQSAQEVIETLKQQKKALENEIISNRGKVEAKVLSAKEELQNSEEKNKEVIKQLEKEKQKMMRDIEDMMTNKKKDEKTRTSLTILVNNKPKYIDLSLQQDLLALSLMTNEANSIFERENQPLIFSREDLYEAGGNIEHQIRMTNFEKGKSAIMNLETFGDILSHAKEVGADKIWDLVDKNKFVWLDDSTCKKKARMSRLSVSTMNNTTSLDMTDTNATMTSIHESTALSNPSCSSTSSIQIDSLKLSRIEHETSRLKETTSKSLDLSNLKSNMFEAFLNEEEDSDISIIARLTSLIIQAQSDWIKLSNQDGRNHTFANSTLIEDSEQTLLCLACCMKTIRDLAYTLCKVHRAIGLDQLKEMSATFKDNVIQGCNIVKKYPAGLNNEECQQFEKILKLLIEVAAALSLSSIDDFPYENDEMYLSQVTSSMELCANFLQCQNRFLIAMIDDAQTTVETSVDVVKDLILTRGHEISDDLLDGVMNILTSIVTLLQTCKDLLMVHYDMNVSTDHVTLYSKECFLLRQFLTAIVDYNEDIFTMVERSKEISKDCDNLDSFLDVPIELADTTKCICNTGRDLLIFVSEKKNLDEETLLLLQDCYEKFEFAGKAVRVGVTIVAQEVEKDLSVDENNSVLSVIQADESLARNRSLCPLNRTSLDVSEMSDNLRNSFGRQSRQSSKRSDTFISRYMDSTILED